MWCLEKEERKDERMDTALEQRDTRQTPRDPKSSALDGGREAWLNVLGYAFICVGTLGAQYAFGALYAELLDALGGSPGATAFVGSLCAGMMLGGGGVSGVIVSRLGARRACMIGGLMAAAGTGLSALATEVRSPVRPVPRLHLQSCSPARCRSCGSYISRLEYWQGVASRSPFSRR